MMNRHPLGSLLASCLVLAGCADVGTDVASADAAVAAATIPEGPSIIATPASSAIGHQVARQADGLFYVHAMVNGRQLRLLVDTGASIAVLTEADARAVGVELDDGHFNGAVRTVGGSTAMAWTTLDNFSLAGHELRNVRVGVVRGGLGVSLLGQNLLSRMESVTISADRLSLR